VTRIASSARAKPYWLKLYLLSRQYIPPEYEEAVWTQFLQQRIELLESQVGKSMTVTILNVPQLEEPGATQREYRDTEEARMSR
jgi:hypothetical protein